MRLKPAVSSDDALEYLSRQAAEVWGITVTDEIRERLRPTADAMAAVSRYEVPDGIDPMFL
jgi:hypothetical protein